MKEEYFQFFREVYECVDLIFELIKMVFVVYMLGKFDLEYNIFVFIGVVCNVYLNVFFFLVVQCEEFKEKYIEEQRRRKKFFNEV